MSPRGNEKGRGVPSHVWTENTPPSPIAILQQVAVIADPMAPDDARFAALDRVVGTEAKPGPLARPINGHRWNAYRQRCAEELNRRAADGVSMFDAFRYWIMAAIIEATQRTNWTASTSDALDDLRSNEELYGEFRRHLGNAAIEDLLGDHYWSRQVGPGDGYAPQRAAFKVASEAESFAAEASAWNEYTARAEAVSGSPLRAEPDRSDELFEAFGRAGLSDEEIDLLLAWYDAEHGDRQRFAVEHGTTYGYLRLKVHRLLERVRCDNK
jgi:hypothetical protein